MELTLEDQKPNKLNEMALRDATDRDVPALLDVLLAAFLEYQQVLEPPSASHTETLETVRRRLGRGWAVVAEIQNQIVGFAFYEVQNDGLFYFSRLSVLPAFRRRGIGLALVKYIESRAGESNAPGVQAWRAFAAPASHRALREDGLSDCQIHDARWIHAAHLCVHGENRLKA